MPIRNHSSSLIQYISSNIRHTFRSLTDVTHQGYKFAKKLYWVYNLYDPDTIQMRTRHKARVKDKLTGILYYCSPVRLLNNANQ